MTSVDDAKALDGVRALVISAIANEKNQELLYLQTIRDAAILAGEQVQDVRIDVIEKPPGVSASDILLDLLLSVALNKVASEIVNLFADWGARAIIAMRKPKVKGNGTYRLKEIFDEAGLSEAIEITKRRDASNLITRKETYEYWNKAAKEILAPAADMAKSGAKKGITLPVPPSDPDHKKAIGGDSASVAVRRAALSSIRLQEAMISTIFDGYVEQVTSASVDIKQLLSLNNLLTTLRFNRAKSYARSNGEVERELSLLFEACIWLMHFGGIEGITQQTTSTYKMSAGAASYWTPGSAQPVVVIEVDRPLVQYWIRRFPHPQGDGRITMLQYVSASRFLSTTDDEVRAGEALLDWFEKVENSITLAQSGLNEKGLEVDGPVKMK